jgi:fatty-acyl-CoA synthase
VPLFHCFGCVLCVLAAVSHASTMFIAILDHPLFAKFDFSSLRSGIMAGSPWPVKTMRQAIDLMHLGDITICYGLTEASPVLTQTRVDDDLRRRTESVGRAMPGIEVLTVDPQTGADCPPGVQGEVVCRGYNVMKGYYNQPEETASGKIQKYLLRESARDLWPEAMA